MPLPVDQLPQGPQALWQAIRRLQRDVAERGAQLLTILRRTDGSTAMTVGTPAAGWALYDQSANAVLAEDTLSGAGLALPYLQNVFAPARYTDWLASTSATFEDVHRATIKKLQPYAYVSLGYAADTSGTTGEVQVTVNGTPIGTPTAVTFAIGAVSVGPFALPGAYKSQIEIRVQAHRTGGTGTIRCAVLAASGLQS